MSAVLSTPYTGIKAKILNFLGCGVDPSRVASAVGCDPSYISQLLSDEHFAEEVTSRRLATLQETTNRDNRINSIEDKLISRTEELVASPLAFTRPMEAIRALHTVNSLKRRGTTEVTGPVQSSVVVQLTLPKETNNRFTIDINNQIIKTGDQTLVTISSGSVKDLAEKELVPLEAPYKVEKKKGVPYNELTPDDLA